MKLNIVNYTICIGVSVHAGAIVIFWVSESKLVVRFALEISSP